MVAHPAEYRWSSYRANAQAERDDLLQAHPVYERLGADPEARCATYRELFRYELDPGTVDEIRQATNGNFALGDARFGAEIAAALGRRTRPGRSGRPCREQDAETRDLFDGRG